jgi:hypothetical protein
MKKTNISSVISELEKLVYEKYLIITADKYVAVIIDGLWKQFDTIEKQHTLLRNLLLYCNLKNAYSGSDINEMPKLQLVVKSTDKILSMHELHKGKVKSIDYDV